MRRPTKLLAASLVLGLALLGYKAARAIDLTRSALRPPRGALPLPGDAGGLGALVAVAFEAPAGGTVRGWYVPSTNGAAVVLAHGSPSTRAELVPEARLLASHGYGVMLFDFPGHGESDGPVDWGRPSEAALTAALDHVIARAEIDPRHVGGLGFSYGSAVLAQVAARDRRLASVVLVGAFTTLEDQIHAEFGGWGPVTALPALWASRRAGLPVDDLRPADVVGAVAPRPLLLIGGSLDRTVPPELVLGLYARAAEPKEVWIVPGAHHGDYRAVAPVEYQRRLLAFFDRTLRAEQAAAPR